MGRLHCCVRLSDCQISKLSFRKLISHHHAPAHTLYINIIYNIIIYNINIKIKSLVFVSGASSQINTSNDNLTV